MSAGTTIVQAALRQLQAHSEASSASAATLVIGKDKLNAMLQLWISQGILLETTPISSVGGEVSEPEDALNGIILNLAVELEMEFGVSDGPSSQRLHANAKKGYNDIKRLYQSLTLPMRVVSSTTPVGAGNPRYWNTSAFKPRDGTVNG